MGYLFYPLTLIIGVPLEDAYTVSRIIGERTIVTEVVSYNDLAYAMEHGLLQHSRSSIVTAYALCGFAHIASMAIFVGGVAALRTFQKKRYSRYGAKSPCRSYTCMSHDRMYCGSILF